MIKVCICGAGPSAAYAVLACREFSIEPTVISAADPAVQQDGAFFLHWLPEYLARRAEPREVQIRGLGVPDVYTIKQWYRPVRSSFPEVPRMERWYPSSQLLPAWDGVRVMRNKLEATALCDLARQYDLVLHTFTLGEQQGKRRYKFFPVRTFFNKGNGKLEIVYNGLKRDPWVRMTTSFNGRVSFEFPDDAAVLAELEYNPVWCAMERNQLRDIPPETEPIARSEWLAPNVRPIGRFATWDRKKLSHHAFDDVMEMLRELGA